MAKCKKVRYRTELDAKIALAFVRDTKNPQVEAKRNECRFYRCPHCSGWHLTSQPYRSKIS